ncbi:MFS transporter [Solicola gregarius]|uniref:MFS transporter n=1 Tax=Solicola gregarius TaxID=2908642 RepID=A0AA46TGK9_9ACTN|nr:MFS transporter [Solicola gregarius]UYM04885.1 MFS transporter [Solicola gregarius]
MSASVPGFTGHLPGSVGLRKLNTAMLAAGIAAFGTLYSTQALMPTLGDEFDVSATQASLTVSAATGALALAVVPMSVLAEAIGRTLLMRIGLCAVSALVFLSAVAPTFTTLVGARALIGIAVAAVIGVAMGHVGAEVNPRAVGAAMGLYVAGNSLGGIGGRLVSATVDDLLGWRVSQGAIGLVCVASLLVFWTNLPPSESESRDASARTIVRDLLRQLRNPALALLYLLPFLLMGGFVAMYNYLTFRLETAPFDLPSSVVSLVFLAYLSGTAASVVAGRLADRFGRPPVVCGAIVAMAAGLAVTVPDRLSTIIVGTVLFTTGFFAAHSAASGWVPRLAQRPTTIASAIYVLAYYAGSSVFGTSVGVAWSNGGWHATAAAVGVLATLALLAAVGVSLLARPRA